MQTAGKDICPDTKDLECKIIMAKSAFSSQQAWFGSLVGRLSFKLVTDGSMPTCATDGKTIFFGADYVRKHNTSELVFTIGHEILHCLLNHFMRRTPDKNFKVWNVACDYVVNPLLVLNRVGSMPKGALFDKKYSKMTAEEVYDLLMQKMKASEQLSTLDVHEYQPPKDKSSGTEGEGTSGKMGDAQPGEEPSDSAEEDVQEGWKELFEEAVRGAEKFSGKNGVLNDLQAIQRRAYPGDEAKVDWQEVLGEFIKTKFNGDISYLKPHKRSQSIGVVVPSVRMEESLHIAIALDTSGSIDQDQLKVFLNEVNGILTSYDNYSIHLWCFDTRVHNYVTLSPNSLSSLEDYELKGGGGTNFRVNWEHLESESIQPDLLLMLTDGYPSGDWGDADKLETLFAIVDDPNHDIVAPFGTTIYLE